MHPITSALHRSRCTLFFSLWDTGTSGVVWEAVAPSMRKMHPCRPGGCGSCRERQEMLVVVAASDVKSTRLGTRMGALTSLRLILWCMDTAGDKEATSVDGNHAQFSVRRFDIGNFNEDGWVLARSHPLGTSIPRRTSMDIPCVHLRVPQPHDAVGCNDEVARNCSKLCPSTSSQSSCREYSPNRRSDVSDPPR